MSENRDYNPFRERNVERPTNDFESFMLFTQGALGAGFLIMPYAFRFSGLWTGVGASVIAVGLAYYCTYMLVKCSHELCYRHRVPTLGFAETAEKAFVGEDGRVTYPGAFMRFLVNAFILIDLLGSVCVFLISVGENIQQVFNVHQPNNNIKLTEWILMLGLPLMFISLLRSLKTLAPFAFFSNGLIFLGLIIALTFIFSDLPNISERSSFVDFRLLPMFFVVSLFALELNTIILNVEHEMRNPQLLTKWPSLLFWAGLLTFVLYAFVGFFGYWKYGKNTSPYITLNIPMENGWGQSVKIIVAVALFCLILLPFYVSMAIIWESVSKSIPKGKEISYESILRAATALICTLIAACFPNLDGLLSFVAALAMSTLAFIVPAVLDLVVFGDGFLKMRLIKDIIVIVFGVIIAITGLYESTRGLYLM